MKARPVYNDSTQNIAKHMTLSQDNTRTHGLWTSLKRGAFGQCPNCGKTRLLVSYTKQVQQCASCKQNFGHIRADDGPAWLTILIVGHILGALALSVIPHSELPDWLLWLSLPVLALALIVLVLPRAKGFFIALIWHTGCSGSEA